jgi:glycosyltransferase involved in cell wall biosynthesis
MLVHQSIKPTEIVLVQDGPVPLGLSAFLDEYESKYPEVMRIIRLDKNYGLGNALRLGVENAKYDICARMDSDDICMPDRFEKQLAFLELHSEVDIVGGQMVEFIDSANNIIGRRDVPLTNEAIYGYMKSRCALNHVTVMFRKEAVLQAGNYQDWFWNEDYYLWVRMMMNKCVFANVPDVLVKVRSGADQYARRGGKKYFDSEIGIKKLMLKEAMITRAQYVIYYIERFIVQLMMPKSVRGWVYRTFARK